jgi:protein RecA
MPRKKTSEAAQVMQRINSQMKANVVTMASDKRFTLHRVPTGSLVLDRLTNGGFARGRHVVLYGDFSAGKSLVVYKTLALAQARGETCAIVDGEGVFNEDWFRQLGGQPSNLVAYRPKTANELGNVLQLFVQDDDEVRGIDICGIDSVASLLPKEELEHDFEEGDARVASLARLMSLLLRKVTTQNDDTLFLWTNQWRDKIARIPGLKSTPGGHSLGFYASTRIEMMAAEKENEDRDVIHHGAKVKRKVPVGQWVTCKLTKEKTGARPLVSRSFMLDLDTRQIDTARELVDLGMEDGLIDRRGDYYHLIMAEDDELKVYGIKRTLALINTDEDIREWLTACVEERTAELAEVANAS